MNNWHIDRRTVLKGLALLPLVTYFFLNNSETAEATEAFPESVNEKKPPIDSTVIGVRCNQAITDKVTADKYLDSINEEKLYKMLTAGLTEITGKKSMKAAWLSILVGYQSGDSVAIKPNFNFLNHGYKKTITSPQLINVVVRQLVEEVGISPADIYLYDLCKKIPTEIVRDRIAFNINYVERDSTDSIADKIKLRLHYGLAAGDRSAPIKMRNRITSKSEEDVTCYIPKVVTECRHLINMPLMTNHIFISNSGALKNHFGTVRFSNFHSYPGQLHGEEIGKAIVDINMHPEIRNKTRLVLADGLFGVFDRGDGDGKRAWSTFNDDFPKSIFLSKDSVAIDSILAAFVIRERKKAKLRVLSSEYLADAVRNGLGRKVTISNKRLFKQVKVT
jgi:uncharacterized protein (DUF362 family)